MSEKTIDSYLFSEMSEAEREKFEAQFVGDDELFYRIADRENDLVDRYVKGELHGDELTRFETSLADNPARRQKIANSRVLREFIADERTEHKTITIAERTGIFSKITELFTVRSAALQFASVAAIILLAAASIFLLIENRRLGSLEGQLAAATEREAELVSQIEASQDAAGELTVDLDNERKRIEALQAEIAKLRNSGSNTSTSNTRPPVTIATLVLSGARRGGPPLVHSLELPPDATQISTVIALDRELRSERLSVRLNGHPVGSRLRPRTSKTGEKTLSIILPVTKVADGRNELTVHDESGTQVERYLFSMSREE